MREHEQEPKLDQHQHHPNQIQRLGQSEMLDQNHLLGENWLKLNYAMAYVYVELPPSRARKAQIQLPQQKGEDSLQDGSALSRLGLGHYLSQNSHPGHGHIVHTESKSLEAIHTQPIGCVH
ncbi:hypothetical protein V6N13_108910 [Hibiscus sabdariffa]|uniref:Uncharacterized protein n=2 Tax=Hibiscus sabdariffa TaxID=183260 RepID=A0ABR2FNH4_9ROSI